MSKRTGPARIKLSDFKERKGREGSVEVETDDGQVFVIPPPELWPDDVAKLYQENDGVGMCRALLGSDKYDAFVAAGGSSAMIGAIFAEVHGADAGE